MQLPPHLPFFEVHVYRWIKRAAEARVSTSFRCVVMLRYDVVTKLLARSYECIHFVLGDIACGGTGSGKSDDRWCS